MHLKKKNILYNNNPIRKKPVFIYKKQLPIFFKEFIYPNKDEAINMHISDQPLFLKTAF